jgi:hypothetical protein
MEAKEALTFAPEASAAPTPLGCPKCGEPWGSLEAVECSGLGAVRRCSRCGIRATCGPAPPALVLTCERCGLTFRNEDDTAREPTQCSDCRAEPSATEAPEPSVVHAMETEIRSALRDAWSYVGNDELSRYLEGIVRQLTARIDGAPAGSRVVLSDEPTLRILALPSGLILMSTGLLHFLEDEAELAFVLGRELAHVAAGEASARVVRAGLGALAHDDAGRPDTAWTEAMLDLARLGYGRRSELEADSRALRVMLALRYDPTAALNLLKRLKLGTETGNPEMVDVAVAYPPPGYRTRKLERILYGTVGRAPVQRVNREVFRRVAGRRALGGKLTAVELDLHEATLAPPARTGHRRPGRARAILGLILLAALLVLVGLAFRG